jgi:hypothetical protein
VTLSINESQNNSVLPLCWVSPFVYYYAEFHYADCRYAECRYAEFRYAEFRYAECRGGPFQAL